MNAHHHHADAPAAAESIGTFFSRLLHADFVPRQQCMLLKPEIIWLHVVSDAAIALAYYSIPLALAVLVRRRKDLVFNWMFVMFAVFILACGTTHIFNIVAIWKPVYRLDGVVKAATSLASIATAIALWPLIPKALLLPSPAQLREANQQLEAEIQRRRRAEAELRAARDDLERKVQERTEELQQHRDHLNELVEQRTAELEASYRHLRSTERLASLGTLSAGLGHDLGNLLLPVRVHLELLESRVPPELRESVVAVKESTKYLGQLATGLRLLAKDPEEAAASEEPTDLTRWWQDVAGLLRPPLPSGVELSARIEPGLPPVRVAVAPLTQAVFNLVQNAGDALRTRGGGRVEVWARASDAKGEPDAKPREVRIGVSDNGPGMTEEVRSRCLEPFFTTKTRGISTGMGLTLVSGIVQRAGGRLEIESTPGQGTTVIITLPAAERSAKPTATISIADPRARSFTAAVLRALGFEPDAAPASAPSGLVWVTDPPDSPEAIETFLAGDPRRRVVIFGPAPTPTNPRVIAASAPLRPTEAREVLARAAREANRNL